MDLKLSRVRPDSDRPRKRPERPRLPPRPRTGERETTVDRPPILGNARRSTQMVDAGALDRLLADDRRSAGPLAHPWFREEPSEAALDAYDDRRRDLLLKIAVATATTSLSVTVLLLVAALLA